MGLGGGGWGASEHCKKRKKKLHMCPINMTVDHTQTLQRKERRLGVGGGCLGLFPLPQAWN